MNKINQKTIAGNRWSRAYKIEFNNHVERNPTVIIYEEDAIFDGEKTIQIPTNSKIFNIFTEDNATTEFALLNPYTGDEMGNPISYRELQAILYSFYVHEYDRKYNRVDEVQEVPEPEEFPEDETPDETP